MKKPLKKSFCKPFILDSNFVSFNSKEYCKELEKYITYQEKIILKLKTQLKTKR